MDPDLIFYYSTSAHSHFYIGELPDFNTKSTNPPRLKRLPRYHHMAQKFCGIKILYKVPFLKNENWDKIFMH